MDDFLIDRGRGGLPRVTLRHPTGSGAEIYLYGAHVTSWSDAAGRERLFLSRSSAFERGTPIRGGIPVSFPQFGNFGALSKHGFARLVDWKLTGTERLDTGERAANLHLESDPRTLGLWPHPFRAELSVALGGETLRVRLRVINTGGEPVSMTAALHTYLRVQDVHEATLNGLGGVPYLDSANGNRRGLEGRAEVAFYDETDTIYLQAPDSVSLVEGERSVEIRKTGFPDLVVWNPWTRASELRDMDDSEYREMLCVEAAVVEEPVVLAPGGEWVGAQSFRAPPGAGPHARSGAALDQ